MGKLTGQTPDRVRENIEQIAALWQEVLNRICCHPNARYGLSSSYRWYNKMRNSRLSADLPEVGASSCIVNDAAQKKAERL